MTPIRIGIIGAGWVVRNRHLPAIKKIPDAEVGWIWSRNIDKANEVAAEHGIGRVLKEWQEVIDTPEIDAVVVATPPVLHATATLAALKSGKHVLSQARMARNLKEAQEMTQAAQASTLVTALYPARPGLKGHRVMLRLLHEEKFVGELREVRVTGMELAEGKKEYAWASDPDVVGVNAMNLGMWVEVLNRWIGPAKSVSATAKIHHQKRKAYGGDWVNAAVPDSLAVVAELECGATASYHLSTCAACGPATGVEIYGSRGRWPINSSPMKFALPRSITRTGNPLQSSPRKQAPRPRTQTSFRQSEPVPGYLPISRKAFVTWSSWKRSLSPSRQGVSLPYLVCSRSAMLGPIA